jgi:rhodanese-related sulfurtransferase
VDRVVTDEAPYAGDVSPTDAWDMLAREPNAVLVDCRTDAEFAYVGLCDLSALGRSAATIPWKMFPAMALNPDFVDEVKAVQPDPEAPLLFLCRSGQRSRDAAVAMTAAGYARCYNIAGGFEGDCDENRHRGTVNGWKCAGLPWFQR